MRLALTGGTGFIGSRLRERWSHAGHEVLLMGRRELASVANAASALKEFRPEVVIHLATCFRGVHRPEDVSVLVESNILAGANLLEGMKLSETKNLVTAGSSWQHYGGEDYNPVSLYAATKQAFEALLRYYTECEGLRSLSLTLFDTYGPGDSRKKLIPLLVEIAQKSKSGFLARALDLSPGEQWIDLLHVQDICAAFDLGIEWLLKKAENANSQFVLRSGSPIQVRELVAICQELVPGRISVHWGRTPYRPREMLEVWKFGEALPGWTPTISLKEGLRDVFRSCF